MTNPKSPTNEDDIQQAMRLLREAGVDVSGLLRPQRGQVWRYGGFYYLVAQSKGGDVFINLENGTTYASEAAELIVKNNPKEWRLFAGSVGVLFPRREK